MSDEDLRELERRFRETGSVEDEAAWLLGRLRAGDLEEEQLRLAACCSHEPSRIALGEPPAVEPENSFIWSLRLQEVGPRLLARVSVALCLEAFVALEGHRFHARCLEALRALEAWAANPSPELAGRARRLSDRCSWDPFDGSTKRQLAAAELIFWAGRIPQHLHSLSHVVSAAERLRLDFRAQAVRVALP